MNLSKRDKDSLRRNCKKFVVKDHGWVAVPLYLEGDEGGMHCYNKLSCIIMQVVMSSQFNDYARMRNNHAWLDQKAATQHARDNTHKNHTQGTTDNQNNYVNTACT